MNAVVAVKVQITFNVLLLLREKKAAKKVFLSHISRKLFASLSWEGQTYLQVYDHALFTEKKDPPQKEIYEKNHEKV